MSDDEVSVLQLIRDDLRDIKETQKEMRSDLTQKFSTIHSRIDKVVEDRHKCEMDCKERDVGMEKQMWKTSGMVAGAAAFVVEIGKIILAKVFK